MYSSPKLIIFLVLLLVLINHHAVSYTLYVETSEFNDDVYAAFKKGSDEVYEEVRAHSPLAAKIHESAMNARKVVGDYIQLNDVAYTNKRNAALS